MMDLGIVSPSFPSVGAAADPAVTQQPPTRSTERHGSINAGGLAQNTDSIDSCSCPPRTVVPVRPVALPFECTPANNSKMEAWLLQRFASSTFNTCPHRPLPCMTGPPVEIHMEDGVIPRAVHTAAPVPIHWHEQVLSDLKRDEALGVIERVPYGEPVSWCHRMVVTRKHNGTPRRTVDISRLNKHCKRETFPTESPFHLARRVPKGTWKTDSDAWNGYHSVPLRQSYRHLTTFITPFGRWRYTRAPQGFLSSGDGYNRRFDAILSDFERKERCVDDTIHYDTDLQTHWWRTIDFLIRVGQAGTGIVLKAEKFHFARRIVDFAGFRISDETIESLPKYMDAIRDFPTPSMESRARSIVFWPGMTNHMRAVRELCSACNRSAPSQAATPAIPSPVPSTPFESIFADFFDFGGCHYLVAGDRLSGWVEIFKAPHGTAQAGAQGIIAALRALFATFGVPEEISSDGGPEFSSAATADFLTRWEVRHRMFSA